MALRREGPSSWGAVGQPYQLTDREQQNQQRDDRAYADACLL